MSRVAAVRLFPVISLAVTAIFAIITAGSSAVSAGTGSGLLAWSQPAPIDPAEGIPRAIACPSDSFCVEVNDAGNALTYNHGVWSSPIRIDPYGGGLNAISCPATTFCIVLDRDGNAMSYNDGTWSSPLPIDPNAGIPTSVSCPTTTFCIAVDSTGRMLWYGDGTWSGESLDPDGGGFIAVSCPAPTLCFAADADSWIIQWSGTLSSQGVPIDWEKTQIEFDPRNSLSGLSCASDTFCIAVDDGGLAFYWFGAGWQSGAVQPGGVGLQKVSCATSNFCVVVDRDGSAFILTSETWSSAISIDPKQALSAISCVSSAFCAAIDYEGNAVIYNGTWSSPVSVDPTNGGGLTSVSCPTASFCVAVDQNGYAVSFSGGSWSPLEKIDPGGVLASVSCPATTFCVAVDYEGRAVTYADGSWSSPDAIDANGGGLGSVSCPTANFCVAVDEAGAALSYSAGAWSSPVDIDAANLLTSVACPTANLCTAVDRAGHALTYANGSWSLAVPIDTIGLLASVSCTTSGFCAAVDSAGDALTYSGGRWSSPEEVNLGSALFSVSCPTLTFCVAVGDSGSALIYGGGTWAAAKVGNPASTVASVSCPSASFCAAVDQYNAYTYALPTTTAITSVSSSPVVGEGISIEVEVTGPTTTAGSPTPSGLVSISDGTNSCKATLSGSNGQASGMCSIAEAAAGYYELIASYRGDPDFNASSALTSTTVAKATSTTMLRLSAAKETYGDEDAEHLSVTVSPEYAGVTPSGTATVSTSTTPLCTVQLSAGQGLCSLSRTHLGAGAYSLSATYAGSNGFYGSLSTIESLTVGRATSTSVLGFSTAKVTYGDESVEHLAVTVSPEFPGLKPTGTVTVSDSTKTLCTLSPVGACTLSAKELRVGTFSLTASYGGDEDFDASISRATILKVAKETSKIVLKASDTKVTYGHEAAEHLSVTVLPEFKGVTPTGTVTVSKSTTKLCVISLSSGKGSCTLPPKKLKIGKYRLDATYRGTDTFDGATSTTRTLVVAK